MALDRIEASDFQPDRAVPVGDVLRRWAARSGIVRAGDREKIWCAWEALLGSDAAHTRLEGLRKGVALFVVDSSALLSELNNFRKQELLEGLAERIKAPFISDLKFRLEKIGRRPGGATGRPEAGQE